MVISGRRYSIGKLAGTLARRLRGCRRGGVAVEFGLLTLPFFMCLLGGLDLLMVTFVSATMDAATINLAREIRTGQLQLQGGASEATVVNYVCGQIGFLNAGCPGSLAVDVRTIPTFTSANPQPPIQNGQFKPSQVTFNMGNQGDLVLVTVYFAWPMLAPNLDHLFNPLGNGTTIVSSSTAFRNEPYEAG